MSLTFVFFLLVSNVPLTWLNRTNVSRSPRVKRQTEDFNAGGLPSHLPSPPEHPEKPASTGKPQMQGQIGAQGHGHGQIHGQGPPLHPLYHDDMMAYEHEEMYHYYNYDPFYNPPETHLEFPNTSQDQNQTKSKDSGKEKEKPHEPAPFGLDETILILVPQFKYTIHGFPEWAGASVRLSVAFTIFFDELDWTPDPPPPPERRRRSFLDRIPGQGQSRNRRSKSILSLPPPDSLVGGERATLIPKVEKILGGTGVGDSRACLLRSVCEVHAEQIERTYGFFGEFMKQIFSVSRSQYSETHLASYLAAERQGRRGNCSDYFQKCEHSLFH